MVELRRLHVYLRLAGWRLLDFTVELSAPAEPELVRVSDATGQFLGFTPDE